MNYAKGGRDRFRDPEIVNFRVIGELKRNPHLLLLLGDDGKYYGYDIIGGTIDLLDPDDSWAMDVIENTPLRMDTNIEMLAS
jgi:hypothetical protein